MRLLVSVSTPADARAALAGGADIIDAKDPSAGALGAVSLDMFRCIADAVPHRMTLTAALDDAAEELGNAQLAEAFTAAGADFV